MKFTDFGDEGTYTGDLSNGKRHGVGKMVYDSGNTYEGGFKDNLMHGKGLYTWIGELHFVTDYDINAVAKLGTLNHFI
jgi:hypothetical protein